MSGLVKLLIAIVGLIFASFITKGVTGKHIHEHVFEWWGRLRGEILRWAHEHRHLGVVQFIARVDQVMSGLARLTVVAHQGGTEYAVAQERVNPEEAYRMFPQLRHAERTDITSLVLNN